jgi:shikimate dehydrogenase
MLSNVVPVLQNLRAFSLYRHFHQSVIVCERLPRTTSSFSLLYFLTYDAKTTAKCLQEKQLSSRDCLTQNNLDLYAVVGNPIAHSKSPIIHRAFARQAHQMLDYTAIELPIDNFESKLRQIQQQGYKGVNVIVPFKQEARRICDKRSPRAEAAGAVNTLIFSDDGKIFGDNTDGVGLTRDLVNNHHVLIKRRKVLILGAGGAVRGVLAPLLALDPASITIANSSVAKARKLAKEFHSIGDVKACGYDDLRNEKFDLIINGTSAGLNQKVPPIPHQVLGINSVCYDMMYNISVPTAFVKWAQNLGASRAFDGLGTLVEQAAESFYIWRGVRPATSAITQSLRQ